MGKNYIFWQKKTVCKRFLSGFVFESKWIVLLAPKVIYVCPTISKEFPLGQIALQSCCIALNHFWKRLRILRPDVSPLATFFVIRVQKLRIKVEGLQDKNTRLEIKRDNQAYDLQETTAK